MATWPSDTLTRTADTVNQLLMEQNSNEVVPLATFDDPLFQRIQTESDVNNQFLGAGFYARLRTNAPSNGAPRREMGNVPLPIPSTFTKFRFKTVEYMASVGMTKREMEEVSGNPKSVVALKDMKLQELRTSLHRSINQGLKGDGTGRLARIASVNDATYGVAANPTVVLTVDNAAAAFGYDLTTMIEIGQMIDIVLWGGQKTAATLGAIDAIDPISTSTNFDIKRTNLQVTGVTSTTVTATYIEGISNLTEDGTALGSTTEIADNDVIVMANSITHSDYSTGGSVLSFNQIMGILGLVDDGCVAPATPGNGTPVGVIATAKGKGGWFGNATGLQGLPAGRLSYPQFISRVYSKWSALTDAGVAGTWDLEDLQAAIREVDNGTGGGKITALYTSYDMPATITRKAALNNNVVTNITGNEVTGGFYTKKLCTDSGRMIPIIPMQRVPKNTIYGVCEDDFRWFQPVPIGFETFGHGTGPFFPSPGSRNGTFEAWIRFVGQFGALRTDNCFRYDGLAIE